MTMRRGGGRIIRHFLASLQAIVGIRAAHAKASLGWISENAMEYIFEVPLYVHSPPYVQIFNISES